MKIFSLVLLLLISQGVFAQTKPLDNGRVDSLIKSHVANPPSQDYYIIAFESGLVSTTLTPQIIREIKSINKIRLPHERILLIIKSNNILPTSQVMPYFRDLFDITDKDLEYLRIVVDDKLVDELYESPFQGDAISMYVHQGRLFYKSDAKWYYIHNTPLPHNKIIVDTIVRKALDFKGYNLSLASPFFKAKDGQLMILRDTDKDIFLLNPETGALKKVLDTKDFSAPDIFCEHFVSDSSMECLVALDEQERLAKLKRIQFDIMSSCFDENHYYFNVTLQIVEQLNQKHKIYQDDGEKKIYKPNEYYVGTHGVFLKTDKDFQNPEIFKINTAEDKIYYMEYPNYDGGFLARNDTLYFKNMFWPFYPLKKKMLQTSVLRNNEVVRGERGPVKFTRKEQIYDFSALGTPMTFYKGKVLYKPSLSKHFYEYHSKKPVSELTAFGMKGVKPLIVNNAKKANDIQYSDPYFIYMIEPIVNNEYLACMYIFNNDKIFLEIKDSTYKTISTIDLSQYPQMPKVSNTGKTQMFHSLIQGDYLYILTVEGDEHVLYSYHFKESLAKEVLSKQEIQAQKNKKE